MTAPIPKGVLVLAMLAPLALTASLFAQYGTPPSPPQQPYDSSSGYSQNRQRQQDAYRGEQQRYGRDQQRLQNPRRSGDAQQRQQQQRRTTERDRQVSVTGQILRIKQVDVRGGDRQELVALLRTRDGRQQIVDLGSARNLGQTGLRTGEQITVRGRQARRGDKQVVLASQVYAGGNWVNIDRQQQRGQRSQDRGYRISGQSRTIQGQVVGTRSVRLRGSDTRHLVARIRSQGNRYHTADLGPRQRVQERLSLNEGDWIRVQGRTVRIQDRSLLLASRVQTRDESVRISRDQQRRGEQAAYRDGAERRESSQARRAQSRSREGSYSQEPRTVTVVARDMQFDQSRITARPGERLRIQLVNRGNAPHSIEFELPSGERELESALSPGQSRTMTIAAPQESGQYTFYCPVGNHRERGMRGVLVVREEGVARSR